MSFIELSPQHELEALGYKQELHRSLGCLQLTVFGLNYMIPIAPAIIFGLILQLSGGTVALPYFLAGIGMSFTAVSYGILIRKYPVTGSLYSYVSRGINPYIGFIAGWVLLLDYVLIPTVTSMSASYYLHQFLPHVPYIILLCIFSLCTGVINLFGIELMAMLGLWILVIGEVVIFVGFGIWAYAVGVQGIGVGHLFSLMPFHFHSLAALATATSLAIASYLGFDAITTLAEEAKNPKRDIPRAIFWSVLLGGFTMVLTGYLGMLVIPHWQQMIGDENWLNTTLFYVNQITAGKGFTICYTVSFILAMAVFNVVATAAGARLLFGMGRDNVISKKVFAALNKRWATPHWSILIIAVLECVIGSLFSLEDVSEVVNYGALLGFILLNFTVVWIFYFRRESFETTAKSHNKFVNTFTHFIVPLLGVIVISWVFIHVRHVALVIGTSWMCLGIIYGGYRLKQKRTLDVFTAE